MARLAKKQVVINVYDLHESNNYLYSLGLGMYHSGVQIDGKEYTFASEGGIFNHDPRSVPNATFRECITMGEWEGTSKELDSVISELRRDFRGDDYHIMLKNCNEFANQLVFRLLNKSIPAYINRMAYLGQSLSCLLPPALAGRAPVNNQRSPTNDSVPFLSHSNNYNTRPPSAPFSGRGYTLGS